MLVEDPEFQDSSETAPTLTELRNRTIAKTAFTSGTDLELSNPNSPQRFEHDGTIPRINLYENGQFTQNPTQISDNSHDDSMNGQSSQNLTQSSNNSQYDNINGIMMKIETIVRPIRPDRRGCPARARVSPVRWWLGERINYNKEGKISGKLKRCNV